MNGEAAEPPRAVATNAVAAARSVRNSAPTEISRKPWALRRRASSVL